MPSSSLGFHSGQERRRVPPNKEGPLPSSPPRNAKVTASGPESELPVTLLLRWNASMSFFHFVLFIVTVSAGNIDLTVKTYRTALDFVERSNTTGWDLIQYYVEANKMPFTILTALFFLITSIAHLLNCTAFRRIYLKGLSECRTPLRWIEYSLSAPIMILLISYALGVRERSLLAAIFGLVTTTMFFGQWAEERARPLNAEQWESPFTSRIFPLLLGHVPQIFAWGVIILQFYDAGFDQEDSIPWWVHFILWTELFLFFSFAAASFLSQSLPPRLLYRGEILFQVLSLVSKGLLGSGLLANVLMLSSFDDVYKS